MKKRIFGAAVVIVAIVLIIVAFNSKNDNQKEKVKFDKLLSSLYTGSQQLNLNFKCYNPNRASWKKSNIESVRVAVGSDEFDVNVDELKLEDELIDNKYYMGHITLSGEFETSIGDDARLIVKEKDDNEEHSYEIGTLVFINDENENYKECSFVNAEAVLKTDNNDNVYNYGIIIELNTNKNIEISNVRLGLDNYVEVDNNYKIFNQQNFEEIHSMIGDSKLENKIKDVYKKKFYETIIIEDLGLKLQKGKNYVYFPLKYKKGNTLSLDEAVISINYKSSGENKEKVVTNSATFYVAGN